jgi:hypothetical protein
VGGGQWGRWELFLFLSIFLSLLIFALQRKMKMKTGEEEYKRKPALREVGVAQRGLGEGNRFRLRKTVV